METLHIKKKGVVFYMSRDFNTWLAGFRDSIADYGYYIDFEKVHRNVDGIKVDF